MREMRDFRRRVRTVLCLLLLGLIPAQVSPLAQEAATTGICTLSFDPTQMGEVQRLGEGEAYRVDIHPDGAIAAVASSIGVWLYDLKTLQPLHLLEDYPLSQAQDSVWSPDGTQLAAAYADGSVRIWSADGSLISVMKAHRYGVYSVAWSPDGAWLATGSVNELRVWEVADMRQPIVTLEGRNVDSLAWSPDGAWLAVGDDSRPIVPIFDTTRWEEERTLQTGVAGVTALAWSPDGSWFVVGGIGGIEVWSVENWQVVQGIERGAFGISLSWSPDGARLAYAAWPMERPENMLAILDATSGEQLVSLIGHAEGAAYVDWSPDGAWLVSIGRDGTLRTWNAASGQQQAARTVDWGRPRTIVWSPDSTRIAAVYAGEVLADPILIWDAQTAQVEYVLEPDATSVYEFLVWSPDGSLLALAYERLVPRGNNDMSIWDTRTGERVLTLNDTGGIIPVWSPDSTQIALIGASSLQVFDVPSGQIVSVTPMDNPRDVVWLPEGLRIISRITDNTFGVRNVTNEQPLATIETDLNRAFASLSPQGNYVILRHASDPAAIEVWSVEQRERLLYRLESYEDMAFHELTWLPDETCFAVSDAGGIMPGPGGLIYRTLYAPSISIRDTFTGRFVAQLVSYTSRIFYPAWSPDGTRFAFTNGSSDDGGDGVIRILGVRSSPPSGN